MLKLTFSMENYLEAVYELSDGSGGARVSDVASRLGVTKASTNNAIAALASKGLVTAEKYKEIYLTPKGLEVAKTTYKKHQVIKHFFTDILKIDPVIADRDACTIEHVISKESINAMKAYMESVQDPGDNREQSPDPPGPPGSSDSGPP